MDWTHAFLIMCELEGFHESYSSGILPDKISTLQLLRKWEVNERLCIGEVGADLELVFMPMDPMWNLSWKLLAKYLIIWVILSVSLNWILYSYGFDHIILLWSHSSDKLKYLSSVGQYIYPTSILLYLWVYPPVSREYQRTLLLPMGLLLVLLLTEFRFPPGSELFHSRTPISESILHSDSITLSNFHCLWVY